MTTIGGSAFSGCSTLASLTIPNSVKIIEGSAFYKCTSLTSIIIPASVKSIGSQAFRYCISLTDVYSLIKTPFYISQDAFVIDNMMTFTDATLHVPAGTMAKYKATDGWKLFKNIVEISNVIGDVNGDGEVNVGDIVTVCNVMAGNSTVDPQLADVNGDGEVNVGDIVTICNIMAGK